MKDQLVQIADGFWNVRGSFRVAGVFDAGTHTSLVRLRDGGFVLLDAYTLDDEPERQVQALTDQGRAVRAVLNLHPFHTRHVEHCLRPYPHAKLYGTRRHKEREPALPWQPLETDDPALHALFADDFLFSVPRGVELIPKHQGLHFASVLAFHRASKTLHVDDTLTWVDLPLVRGLRFHPSLRFVLERRPGAVAAFRGWVDELLALCADTEHLCTAHAKPLPPQPTRELPTLVREAVARVDSILRRHERKYG